MNLSQRPNVAGIVSDWLLRNDFDGLVSVDSRVGCSCRVYDDAGIMAFCEGSEGKACSCMPYRGIEETRREEPNGC